MIRTPERAFFLTLAMLLTTLICMYNDWWMPAVWFGIFTFVSMYVCYNSED